MGVDGQQTPTVSIGLPVFNAENYLREALDSILAQTFDDFELVVCDNASTDRTVDIVQEYVARDPRVRYFRNDTNIGGARNQARVAELSRGRYLRFAAHDDRVAPTLLEECVRELERQPDAVICYPATIVIEADGTESGIYRATRGTAATTSQRFRELAFRTHNCDAAYGVMRREVVQSVRPMGDFIDADKPWLCDLAMRGRFLSIDRPLFYKRYHPKNYVANWRDRMAWYRPERKGKPSFPNWLELQAFVRVVITAKIPRSQRLRCAAVVAAWTVYYSPKLAKDLLVAARLALYRARHKQAPEGIYNWE
jgi:glycosyltransferase involved in cell wall biosynthesis